MKKKPVKKNKTKIPWSLIVIFAGIALIILTWLTFTLLSLTFTPSPKNKPLSNNIQSKKSLPLPVKVSSASASSKAQDNKPAYHPQIYGNQLRVSVLMYHYVGNNPNPIDLQRDILSITPDKFDTQMKYLHDNGYVTISLDTLYAALEKKITLPNKAIVLTFDDGYMDFYFNAYPILRKYNLRATEFIPTGLINQGYYLTWAQIKEMQSSGLITYGAHTIHHYNLPTLSTETALSELTESKNTLQKQLGVPINFLAYPYGATDSRITDLAKQAGYLGATGTWANQIQSQGTIYNMPRLRISGDIDFNIFTGLL